jgi:hypothetical protein
VELAQHLSRLQEMKALVEKPEKKRLLEILRRESEEGMTWTKSNLSVFALESSILGYSTLDKACENGFHQSYGILACLV